MLSVPEVSEKPAEYPAIFARSKALLINNNVLLDGGQIDFEIERAKTNARRLDKSIGVFPASVNRGDGMAH